MLVLFRMVVWILLGAGCGCGSLLWADRLLRNRGRTERLSGKTRRLLVIGTALLGGAVGYCMDGWLAALFAAAVMTVAVTVGITDWLCRVIPNPTVLAVLGLGLVRMVLTGLKVPGLPEVGIFSGLGGMVFCFALFFAPGLLGKQPGAGDIKLAAAMGLLLGFTGSLLAVIVMGLLMLAYAMAQRQMPLLAFLKTNVPMGPFISAGMVLTLLYTAMTL